MKKRRIFIINVGVNASHGSLRSPIYDDSTFEFIPIPEEGRWHSAKKDHGLVTYSNLKLVNENQMECILPKAYWNRPAHNDPEFHTFTYGDYPSKSPRAANLKRIERGDILVFLARLVLWRAGRYLGPPGFFLVGYFEIKQIFREIAKKPHEPILSKIKENAHVKRGLLDKRLWNGFWVFKGSKNSCRFKKAVRFDKDFADAILRTSSGNLLDWSGNRSELQVIGSYTRACRIIDNPEKVDAFLSRLPELSNSKWIQ